MNLPAIQTIETFDHLILGDHSPTTVYMRGRKHRSAIDIGCRDAHALNILYHDYGVPRLVGIDIETEERIVERMRQYNPDKLNAVLDMYDLYSVRLDTTNASFDRTKLDRTRYYEKFKFYLGPEQGSAHRVSEQFELVILSNVLHYEASENDCLELLGQARRLMLRGGDIFIRLKEFFDDGTRRRHFSYSAYPRLIQSVFADLPNLQFFTAQNKNAKEGRALIASTIPLSEPSS